MIKNTPKWRISWKNWMWYRRKKNKSLLKAEMTKLVNSITKMSRVKIKIEYVMIPTEIKKMMLILILRGSLCRNKI